MRDCVSAKSRRDDLFVENNPSSKMSPVGATCSFTGRSYGASSTINLNVLQTERPYGAPSTIPFAGIPRMLDLAPAIIPYPASRIQHPATLLPEGK